MSVYYNENNEHAAQWLENLIAGGVLASGWVDRRSIKEVKAHELIGFKRHHFFAGIGGWELALQLAGWPDNRPVWSGSCPCQGESIAGKKARQLDERHLWPDWYRLIGEHQPAEIFGEQVDDAVTSGWLDDVFSDLEAQAYACAAAVLPAYSVKAHHERQRVFFYANSQCSELQGGALKTAEELQRGHELSGFLQPHTFPALSDSQLWAGRYGIPTDLGYTKANIGAGNAIVPQLAAQFIIAAGGINL